MTRSLLAIPILAIMIAGCGETARQSVEAGTGPAPRLVEPVKTLLPTVKVADATGWPQGVTPVPAAGLRVNEFAGGLQHPRWLYVLPNGDVLVAESDSPGTDKSGGGIKGFFQKMLMKKSGGGT